MVLLANGQFFCCFWYEPIATQGGSTAFPESGNHVEGFFEIPMDVPVNLQRASVGILFVAACFKDSNHVEISMAFVGITLILTAFCKDSR